ncbi:MAG: hypothetical protein ABIS36_00985 [Chryseolinea sp.]
MFVPFDSLPDHSRLWIYQSPKKISSSDSSTISESLTSFTSRWSAHGEPLNASFQILYDQFVLLAVDEEVHAASGCSIDDSARVIKEIGSRIGVDLFDRSSVAFLVNSKVITIPLASLNKEYAAGLWTRQSLLVNTLLLRKGDVKNGLLVPAELTWLKRYLPIEKVVG